MARITKLQKEIFDRHLDAFRKNSFDYEVYGEEGATVDETIAKLRKLLLDGKTVSSLWKYVWERSVSMTSQLMASPNITGYISKKAISDSRKGMKDLLNKKYLSIK